MHIWYILTAKRKWQMKRVDGIDETRSSGDIKTADDLNSSNVNNLSRQLCGEKNKAI